MWKVLDLEWRQAEQMPYRVPELVTASQNELQSEYHRIFPQREYGVAPWLRIGWFILYLLEMDIPKHTL